MIRVFVQTQGTRPTESSIVVADDKEQGLEDHRQRQGAAVSYWEHAGSGPEDEEQILRFILRDEVLHETSRINYMAAAMRDWRPDARRDVGTMADLEELASELQTALRKHYPGGLEG